MDVEKGDREGERRKRERGRGGKEGGRERGREGGEGKGGEGGRGEREGMERDYLRHSSQVQVVLCIPGTCTFPPNDNRGPRSH